jgi:hypothetical protein
MSCNPLQVLLLLHTRGRIHRRSLSWIFYGHHSNGQPLTTAQRASFSRTLRRLKAAGLIQEQNRVLALTTVDTLETSG